MAITVVTGSVSIAALNTPYTLLTDTAGPKVVKFQFDQTWMPGGTVVQLSLQKAPSSTVQFTEERSEVFMNVITMYQTTTGSMTAGSTTLILVTAFGTELVVGQRVVVVGAGTGGANLDTYVTAVVSTTDYILNSAAATTVSGVNVYVGPAQNGQGFEPLWESESFGVPYGFQVIATATSGTLPPLPLNWAEISVA